MIRFRKALRMMLVGSFLTPTGLLLCAGMILAAFALFHLLGWRDDTRILSGTSLVSTRAVVCGMLYSFTYFAAVVACPILILAAGIQAVMQRVFPRA